MRTRRPRARRAGMTLIEVLAALAIFLLSLAAISRLVDYGSDTALEATRVTIGTRLAQSKLAEVEAGLIPVADGGSGEFESEPGWTWEVTSAETDAPNVYLVSVTCTSPPYREVKVGLRQMMLDPNATGNAAPAQPPTGNLP